MGILLIGIFIVFMPYIPLIINRKEEPSLMLCIGLFYTVHVGLLITLYFVGVPDDVICIVGYIPIMLIILGFVWCVGNVVTKFD